MLALVDFSFEFAGRYLYRNASWHIKPGEKIGLVGLNGTGKSTLLRVISGEYELREGTFSKPADLRIGFLNQDLLSIDYADPVLDVVLQGREDLANLDRQIHKLLAEIEVTHDVDTIQKLTELQDQFGTLGGYDWHAEAEKLLEGLGFSTEELQKPLNQFSGGWRMRAMLAKLLLMQPDLLLLDEPTNHLDLPTIQWIEQYLKDYKGTFVVVSHDRLFLDNCVNRIAEVAHQQIFQYKGNFSQYLEQKEERDEMMQRRYDNQQDFIRQQMRFIQRFKAKASKATAVQSRVKMLEKIEKIEVLEDETREMNIRFNIRVTPGKLISKLNNVSKSYGSLQILDHASGEIMRGDKIALIGANGRGKSTLLRMIFGSEPYDGEIETGWNVEPAFFAQHQLEALNLKNDLLNELSTVGGEYTESELRTTLGCFLFTGDEVFKKVKVLSGGEKSRVALAKTLLTQSNFLLLDEPTNHLDMFSTSVLADALNNYKGTFILISHDRTFVSQVANKIWWIEDHKLREYPGTYEEWEEWYSKRAPEPKNTKKENVKKTVTPESEPSPDQKKASKNTLHQLESKMADLEKAIQEMQHEKAMVEEKLQSPEVAVDFQKIQELTELFQKIEGQIASNQKTYDAVMEEWMGLQDS
ncbi:MAG: ABC-F family ATP-binding cassette domain-containing protein [Bacteroidetes bacterium]|nr:ABC-F family ATP-binding cassette domain-containing protein [Bacteroidota bacterium]